MASFCRQRARMENEDEQFWLKEADCWARRLSNKFVDTPNGAGHALANGYVATDFGDLNSIE